MDQFIMAGPLGFVVVYIWYICICFFTFGWICERIK